MEAREFKPVGGLHGEEITVSATPEEWREVVQFIESNPFWPTTTAALDLVLALNSLGIEGD